MDNPAVTGSNFQGGNRGDDFAESTNRRHTVMAYIGPCPNGRGRNLLRWGEWLLGQARLKTAGAPFSRLMATGAGLCS